MTEHLDVSKVVNIFCALTGEDASDNSYIFVESSLRATELRLRRGVDMRANMDALCYAAGCLAYYRFCLSEAKNDIPTFDAGEVSVSSNLSGRLQAAENLKNDALESVSHLFRKKIFIFERC